MDRGGDNLISFNWGATGGLEFYVDSTKVFDTASFQGGVDTLYNQCVSCGATPSSKTPTAIAAAIQAIFTDRYSAGVSSVNKSGHCKIFLKSTWDGMRNHHVVTVTINGIDYISNVDTNAAYDYTQEFDFTL